MKSKCIKRENLIDNSTVAIVANTTIVWGHPITKYSCYIIPIHQHSDPEIVLQNSTLEDCENAFTETLENDLCDIN